jgi:elongation factor Ts
VAEADADQETVHGISMQVAAMSPIAIDADHVHAVIKERELSVAVEKTKQDEINKAIENALRKAGLNPAHADSDDHIESNLAKGWLTDEQAQIARDIRANVPAEAAKNINEKKVEMIAQGRLQKFLKESTLVEQVYVMSEDKALVKDVLKKAGITVCDFKRVTLNQE